ncbi:MAG: hypothetical protein AAFU61_01155, partial [Pseudomonadota bacterium]
MALPLLLPVLGAVAPALAARLAGGGAGAEVLGHMAGALIEEVTGVSVTDEASRDAAMGAAMDPKTRANLRARLREIELEELRLTLADVADARAREVSIYAATGGGSRRADVMLAAAFAAVVGIGVVMFLLSLSADSQNSALINTLVGFLTGIGGMFARNIGTAFDYEFGSSRSSREKDDRLAGLAAAAPGAEGAAGPLARLRDSLA